MPASDLVPPVGASTSDSPDVPAAWFGLRRSDGRSDPAGVARRWLGADEPSRAANAPPGPIAVAAMRPHEGGATWQLMQEALLADPGLTFPGRSWYARLCRWYRPAQWACGLAGVGARLYVARTGGRVAGSLLSTDFTSLGFAGELRYLGHVVVAPGVRGQGIGGELLRTAVAADLAGGARRVLLDVACDNRPAVQLYLGAGFTETIRSVEVIGRARAGAAAPLDWAGLSMPVLRDVVAAEFSEFQGLPLRRLRWVGELGMRWVGLLGRTSVLLWRDRPVALFTDRWTNHRGLRSVRVPSRCPEALYEAVLCAATRLGWAAATPGPRVVVGVASPELPRLRSAMRGLGLSSGSETARMVRA